MLKYAYTLQFNCKYLLFLILIVVFSCQNKIHDVHSNKPNASIKNTYWKVTQIDDCKVDMAKMQRDFYFILELNSDVIKGNSGCNQFNGKYNIDKKGNITLSNIISTRMYCADYEAEPLWYEFIEKSFHFKIEGDNMELINSNQMKIYCEAVYLK